MSDTHLTRDHVVWAYRLLLDRDPENEDAIGPKLRAWRTTRELRTDIMSSAEFQQKNPDHAQTMASTVMIKPLASGGRLFVDLADHVIGLAIVRDGYEQNELQFIQSRLRPGDIAIDVGAHIGFFAIEMAQAVGPKGRIYAFEPLDRNAELLEQSIRESRFEDRIVFERAAVSDVRGQVTLRFARETLNTGGAFVSEGAIEGLGELATSRVPARRLDDLVLDRPVRLIKMDVEGAEPKVIAGARALIERDRPTIVSEIHPEQLSRVSGVSPAMFIGQLESLGLRPHRIVNGLLGERVMPAQIQDVTTLAFV